MKSSHCLFCVSALAVLCAAQLAHATPVGSLTCSTATAESKFNVSYFSFGVETPATTGSSSSGAGAGKVTFKPFEVHAALSTFDTLFVPASSGTHIESCTLTTTFPDGAQATFVFRDVFIESLTAFATMTGNANDPARYTDVQFEYGSVEVKTAGGSDDGGTTVPPGWNRITNSSAGASSN
jgi:Type VI secretion system effector, Hcp